MLLVRLRTKRTDRHTNVATAIARSSATRLVPPGCTPISGLLGTRTIGTRPSRGNSAGQQYHPTRQDEGRTPKRMVKIDRVNALAPSDEQRSQNRTIFPKTAHFPHSPRRNLYRPVRLPHSLLHIACTHPSVNTRVGDGCSNHASWRSFLHRPPGCHPYWYRRTPPIVARSARWNRGVPGHLQWRRPLVDAGELRGSS